MTDDERGFHGSVARIEVLAAGVGLDGVVGLGGVLGRSFRTAAEGEPLLGFGDAGEGSVQADELDAAPEGAEAHPARSVRVDEDVRVDGVPVVTAGDGADDAAPVFPPVVGGIRIQGAVGRDADGRGILPEGRAGIIQIVGALVVEDIRSPGVAMVAGYGVQGPLRRGVEDSSGGLPGLEVGRRKDADAESRAEQIPGVSAADGDGIVYGGLERIEGRFTANSLGRSGQNEEKGAEKGGQMFQCHRLYWLTDGKIRHFPGACGVQTNLKGGFLNTSPPPGCWAGTRTPWRSSG